MDWNKFINFDELIMPSVIKVIYVLGSIGVIISSVFMLSEQAVMAIVVLLGGLLAVRLYCELIIVLFKISANISKIAAKAE